ncbi:hypothetical protein LTR13_011491 [Exophiala sideris]|nr:hypothetical protein LTR13_011491 [Exophiala sideris]KAK5174865.1 hypothetical protein LTR44_011533 [Eurotiomycetes sp. CCFEE 6388]
MSIEFTYFPVAITVVEDERAPRSPRREGPRFPLERVRWHDFEHAIRYFGRSCVVCWFARREAQREHQYPDCPVAIASGVEDGTIRHDIGAWKEMIRWSRYAACFRCGLPSAMCPRFRRRANGRFEIGPEGRCASIGRFVSEEERPVAAMLGFRAVGCGFVVEEYWPDLGWWLDADGVSRADGAAVGRWLGSKVTWEGPEASRMHQVFTWLWVGEQRLRRGAWEMAMAMERARLRSFGGEAGLRSLEGSRP